MKGTHTSRSNFIVDKSYINKILQRCIKIYGPATEIINLLTLLYSRYFFKYPIIIFDHNEKEYIKIPSVSSFSLDMNVSYTLLVDIHRHIVIMPDIREMDHHKYEIKNYAMPISEISKFIDTIDKMSKQVPVIYKFTFSHSDRILKIFHDKMLFVFEHKEYPVLRQTLEMLFAETQDFNFIESNTDMIVKSEVRHSLFYKKEFLCDFLKNDLIIIMDIQDKLKTEHYNTEIPFVINQAQTDESSETSEFEYNPNEFFNKE